MSHITTRKRRRSAQLRLALENLEARHLLSSSSQVLGPIAQSSSEIGGSGAETADLSTSPSASAAQAVSPAQSLIQTSPANGAELRTTPESLIITFPSTDARDFGDNMPIQLYRVGTDGGLTPLFDPNNPPLLTFDDSGTVATIPIGQALPPGHYQIALVGDTTISYILSDGLWDGAQDQVLADFVVDEQSNGLDEATDLGTLGPIIQTRPGFLDLASNSNGVDFYRFTLSDGHFWRLGVQLDASRIGSSLRPALTLFDESGNTIATRDSGSGRPGFPDDPYLFQGLASGVYYLGISGAGNLPGSQGATYSGLAPLSRAGNYQLNVVADLADQPTTVTSFKLNWTDTLITSPTGLTLGFSGPIDLQSLRSDSGQGSAFVAVDQTGKSWTLTLASYDESRGLLTLLFDRPLSAGRYSLRVSNASGLRDLAGLRVIAPGLSAGEFATWTVSPQNSRTTAGNLGVVWSSLTQGVSASLTLPRGQMWTWRLVITEPGTYQFDTRSTSDSWVFTRTSSNGVTRLDDGSGHVPDSQKLTLEPGVYIFTLINRGQATATLSWQLRAIKTLGESLGDHGVGQSSALSLRLVNPLLNGMNQGSPNGTSGVESTPGPGSGTTTETPASPGGEPSSPTFFGNPQAIVSSSPGAITTLPSSNLLVSSSSGLLGRPMSALTTIASSAQVGPGQSIAATDSTGSLGSLDDEIEANHPAHPRQGQTQPVEPVIALNETAPDTADESPRPDEQTGQDALALNRAEGLMGVATQLERWFMGKLGTAEEAPIVAQDDVLASLLGETETIDRTAEGLSGHHNDRIERAELGVPLSVVFAGAAAYRLRQLANGWWRRSVFRNGSLRPSQGKASAWPVPHFGRVRPGSRAGGHAARR